MASASLPYFYIMNKTRLILIVSAMVIALVGIVLVQINWLHKAYQLKTQETESAINDCLNNTIALLEEGEVKDGFTKRVASSGDSVIVNLFHQTANHNSFKIEEIVSENVIGVNDEDIVVTGTTNDQDAIEYRVEVRSDAKGSNANRTRVWSSSNLVADTGKLKTIITKKRDAIGKVADEFLLDLVFSPKPIEERVSKPQVDSIVKSQFELAGLELNFHTDLKFQQAEKGSTFVAEANAEEFDYKKQLFPNDIAVANQGYLVVDVLDKESFVLSSLMGMGIVSGLFCFIILFVFVETLRIIFKQKRLSEMKNDFINNMTHEFKTPIATVNLAVESMKTQLTAGNYDKILNYTRIIQEENNRMNQQVEQVLSAAKLQNSELYLDKGDSLLKDIIGESLNHLDLRIKELNAKVELKLEELPKIKLDHAHFVNSIVNLIDNALKYNDKTPEVSISTGEDSKGQWVTVKDNGLGMSAEAQKKAFEQFYRVPTGNLHNVKGFGLGLSYVSKVVAAHNGSIALKSSLGKGSTFTINLPSHA